MDISTLNQSLETLEKQIAEGTVSGDKEAELVTWNEERNVLLAQFRTITLFPCLLA